MSSEMDTAYQHKLEVFDTAQSLVRCHVRAAGLDEGHVDFIVQRAFALSEAFHAHAEQYLAGEPPEMDPMASTGMAPGMMRKG